MKHKKSFDDFENLEKFERMRGSHKIKTKNKEPLFLNENLWKKISDKKNFAARVVEVHKRYAFVSSEKTLGRIKTNDVWLATVAKKFLIEERKERNFVAVGDRVLCSPDSKRPTTSGNEDDLPRCVIQAIAPRSNEIARMDPLLESRRHIIASNIDTLFVVASLWFPRVRWGLIDRYIALAELEKIPVAIILNKADLFSKDHCSDSFIQKAEERIANYKTIGYPVYLTSAHQNDFLTSKEYKQITKQMKGKISLFTGHSGVGKSTLVNAFDPQIIQVVEPDENIFYKGRHTTSYTSFIKLGTGGFIIDTPGIRSFRLPKVSPQELAYAFKEFRPLISSCKYRQCCHNEEPECGIKDALDAGNLYKDRYLSYLSILLGTSGRKGRLRDQEDIDVDIDTDIESS